MELGFRAGQRWQRGNLDLAEKEAGECGQAVRGLVRELGMAEWKLGIMAEGGSGKGMADEKNNNYGVYCQHIGMLFRMR